MTLPQPHSLSLPPDAVGRHAWQTFPAFRRRQRADGIIETVITRPLLPLETTECVHNLSDYAAGGRLAELVTHEGSAMFDGAAPHQLATIQAALLILGALDRASIAFVAGNDLTFGMCRQLAMRIDAPGVCFDVFRDVAVAERWLLENR